MSEQYSWLVKLQVKSQYTNILLSFFSLTIQPWTSCLISLLISAFVLYIRHADNFTASQFLYS